MASRVIENVELPPPGHYVIAVSGGVDSIALLHLLASHQHAEQGRWQLRVAHYNHGIRNDGHLDQRLVRDIARVYGLPFHTENGNLGNASEQTARSARYKFLQSLVDHYGADAIITAHHLDDRKETSMFNAARGAGPAGASSMRSGAAVLRPLLAVRKDELREYASHHRLPWREDSTNQDIRIARNFIRNELVPLGRQAAPQFDRRFEAAIGQLDRVNQMVEQQFEQLLKVTENTITADREQVAKLQPLTLRQLVVHMARRLDPGAELTQATIQKAVRLITAGKTGSEASITGLLMLRLTPAAVQLVRVNQVIQNLVAQELLPRGSIRFGSHQLSYGPNHSEESVHHHVAPTQLKVRVARRGDRIAQTGMVGTKKLHDIFVDAKIDRNDRAGWPVVTRAIDDEVVWVPRLAVSRHFLISSSEAQAYCLIHEVL